MAATETSRRSRPVMQRERLIAAMATAIEAEGFRETTVADVVRVARTSRRTFYEHFADREECFLALFDSVNDETMEAIAHTVNPERPLAEQVDSAVGAYIESVAARPVLYQGFVRELPGLGQAGAERQCAVIERFAALLLGLVDAARRRQPALLARPLHRDTAIMIVGGLRELLVLSLQQGRDVRELRATVTGAVGAILSGTVSA